MVLVVSTGAGKGSPPVRSWRMAAWRDSTPAIAAAAARIGTACHQLDLAVVGVDAQLLEGLGGVQELRFVREGPVGELELRLGHRGAAELLDGGGEAEDVGVSCSRMGATRSRSRPESVDPARPCL